MATKGRPKTNTGAKTRAKAKKSDLDRRWSILLFGLGLFFFVLSVVPGESGWAWLRSWILFGTFGISGWLVGPMLIWWAVLISLEKPVFPAIIKGVIFLFAFSGLALVFGSSKADFDGMGAGEVLMELLSGGAFGGGLISLVLGLSLLALAGDIAARILAVLLLLIALMVVTGVTPGDIARFFKGTADKVADRINEAGEAYAEDEDTDEALPPAVAPAARRPAPPAAAAAGRRRMVVVDVPLGPGEGTETAAAAGGKPAAATRRRSPLDIDLGPEGPQSEQGGISHASSRDIGPGGTFGIKSDAQDGELGLGDFEPLIPFEPRSPQPLPAADEGMLLFGADDPRANLGGSESRLPPGLTVDVEYLPPDDPGFDLFGRPQPPKTHTPVIPLPEEVPPQAPAQEQPPVPDSFVGRAKSAAEESFAQPLHHVPVGGAVPEAPPAAPAARLAGDAAGVAGTASADPTVDAMIEKAAAEKDSARPADQKLTAHHGPTPYKRPPIEKFDAAEKENTTGVREEMKRTADLLVSTLASFGVQTRILDVSRGPSVTRYEVQPQAGVKISRITGLADDIALNLAAAGVRIEAPIPGKPAVGIEVPNRVKSPVSIRGILESDAFAQATSPLSIALGKDIAGEVVVADLTKMPHLLIAGSTGSGKSVCINSIIMSFLYKSSPEDVKMILIDPKVVELAEYNGIPHLLIPVVTEPRQAAKALGHAVAMMEQRYHTFAELGVRDIGSFNKLAQRDGTIEKMPHIAIVIDELADLMMVAGKDVENFICRIAQKARAAGMHLIVATQRPSVDVITGLIKANIPSRIAFAVSSQVDSRTILDGAGAEKLLGMGDMLFMPIGANKPVRVQGTYVKDREISRALDYVKLNTTAEYDENVLAEMDKVALSGAAGSSAEHEGDEAADMLADQTFVSAVELALDAGEISTSGLQRRLRLGYARAGRIVDQMEQMGIISEPNGSKPRQVLISRQQWQEMIINTSE